MKQIFNILLISAMSLIFFACQGDEDVLSDQIGYLTVSLEQSKDVNTKSAYNAKQMHVVIKDEKGVIKFETQDHTADLEGKEIPLKQGKYTIEAKSSGYDNQSGSDRAYYVGSSEVNIVKGQVASAKVVCSLANVKVTVAFEQSFLDKLGTGTIKVQITSKSSSAKSVDFSENRDKQVTYFPVGDLTVSYTITSKEGKVNYSSKPIENVKAKDHYILNFKNQVTGTGGVTVTVDPTMHQYTYDFTVDPTKESGALISANAWSKIAYLTAKDITVENISALKFQYRQKSTEQWTDVESTPQVDAKIVTATLKGLTAATAYEYQLTNGTDSYAKGEFTTETEVALYNGNFDEWWRKEESNKSPWYPIASGDATSFDKQKGMLFSFWDSGNGGTVTLSKNPTMPEATEVHTPNGKAAKLASQFVGFSTIGKFAAGNVYTGHFCSANMGTYQARINFGQPFASRPTQLKGWFKYNRGKTVDNPSGSNEYKNILQQAGGDLCSIYIALVDNEGFEYDGKRFAYEVNGDLSSDNPSKFQYKNAIDFSENNKSVIAYGSISSEEEKGTGNWQEFTIDLKYRDITRTPKYIIIVASSSKYGDYFTGSSSSVMYVDDFSLVYGTEPTLSK